MTSDLESRAAEIAAFLGIPVEQAIERLSKGFGYQHQAVNDDYRRANIPTGADGNPDPVALLNWYRTTPEYIWELSSYHLDPGFNYSGMCSGIAERLKNDGANRVLCLGDGIGDLTLTFARLGYATGPRPISYPAVIYHDLTDSKTYDFAKMRIMAQTGEFIASASHSFEPNFGVDLYDAVISLDFLEHVDGVPRYVQAIYDALRPGGLMFTQNAFGCGSGPDGSIPMHLTKNDIYVYEWDNLCSSVGFQLEVSNWYRKPN